jgi:hypothetical protein
VVVKKKTSCTVRKELTSATPIICNVVFIVVIFYFKNKKSSPLDEKPLTCL